MTILETSCDCIEGTGPALLDDQLVPGSPFDGQLEDDLLELNIITLNGKGWSAVPYASLRLAEQASRWRLKFYGFIR